MNPDAVYTMLVEANPVPDPDTAPTTPELERLRRPNIRSQTMTLTIPDTDQTPSPDTPARYRWIPAAAAAAIVLLGVGAFVFTRDDPAPVEPVDEPTPTLPAPPSRETSAVTTAEAYLTALYAGDADTVIAMTNPEASNVVADRNMVEMLGTAADGLTVGACTAADEGTWVLVRCEVTNPDPVFVELGIDELVAPIRVYEDDMIDWLPWEGGDFSQANWAYSDYLRMFHTVDYEAVCSPGAYEPGTITSNGNLALTAACAELWAPLSDDVAQWIRDGRPEPAD